MDIDYPHIIIGGGSYGASRRSGWRSCMAVAPW
jgi:hypothetical protein